jgi:hypothetical protein
LRNLNEEEHFLLSFLQGQRCPVLFRRGEAVRRIEGLPVRIRGCQKRSVAIAFFDLTGKGVLQDGFSRPKQKMPDRSPERSRFRRNAYSWFLYCCRTEGEEEGEERIVLFSSLLYYTESGGKGKRNAALEDIFIERKRDYLFVLDEYRVDRNKVERNRLLLQSLIDVLGRKVGRKLVSFTGIPNSNR